MNERMNITIIRDGPYVVTGGVPLTAESIICDRDGTPIRWEMADSYPPRQTYSLCRCGKSSKMPFCDGSHVTAGFKDTEPEPRPETLFFEAADYIEGPGINLYDLMHLCVRAGFCHRGGNIWKMAATSSDAATVRIVIDDACDCPSGRLVAVERDTGEPIEPELVPSISLIEMPLAKLSGPLWVKGGIPIISIAGWQYEIRNRVTLCRCGASGKMPFCDGAHHSIRFNDGSEAVRA